jgi:uncharacterized protein (DUF58 family)
MPETLSSRLKTLGRKAFRSARVDQPLLSTADVDELRPLAARFSHTLPALLETSQPWLGETNSVFRGSGYEFDENRLYQPGDEARFINWRLYARSGQLHAKVFHEEHRPGLFILLDRRAGMRFGTRRQLKVTQAARLACLYLYVAAQENLQVAGVNVEPDIHWHPTAQGEPALAAMQSDFIRPCPPIRALPSQPPLALVLRYLYAMLPPGQQIILISDFHDIDAEHGALLQQLADRHALRAWQVLDAAEQTLPEGGDYTLTDPGNEVRVIPRERAAELKQRYGKDFEARQAACVRQFQSSGIELTTVMNTDDIHDIVKGR